ncbi:MAG TPA: hypothetical protein VJ436_09440 [Anaerolineales bacterium]|nr:hypothetical protein [Anaerolineales bacterium]
MKNNNSSDATAQDWKTRVMLIGGILGALAGVGAAYLLIQNTERSGKQLKVSPGDGVKLGVLLMGLMRQVAELGDSGK